MTKNDSKPRGLLVPVVSAVLSLVVFLGLSVGSNFLIITQNNRNQQKTEQASIAGAIKQEKSQERVIIAAAILANNQNLCDLIVQANKAASQITPTQLSALSVYQKKILADYRTLAVKYKCGS